MTIPFEISKREFHLPWPYFFQFESISPVAIEETIEFGGNKKISAEETASDESLEVVNTVAAEESIEVEGNNVQRETSDLEVSN